ncbi:unnamed protein product [Caenorhabditis brenneri]
MRKLKVSPLLPLLKFPLLVQIEIIKTMVPSEQYFLSKCSKRSHGAVKLSIPKKQNSEIWIYSISPPVYYYLRIADTKFYLFKTYFRDYSRTHEYLCDLFSAPSDVYLEDYGTNAMDFLYEKFVKPGSVKKSILLKTTESMNWSIINFLRLHPNQEFILLHGSCIHRLWTGHRIFEAKSLMLSPTTGFCSITILWSFQGEHLLIEDGYIDTAYVEYFVEEWMTKKNDKLKTAILKLQQGCVIKDLKFEKSNGSSSKHYQYNSPIRGYHKFPNGLFDCSEG